MQIPPQMRSGRGAWEEFLHQAVRGIGKARSVLDLSASEPAADADPLGAGRYGPARYGLGPYHQRLLRNPRPDDEIRADVQAALFYDSWVDADAIEVDVVDAVVTLRGNLPSHDEIRMSVEDAWEVDGVAGVRIELEVAGG